MLFLPSLPDPTPLFRTRQAAISHVNLGKTTRKAIVIHSQSKSRKTIQEQEDEARQCDYWRPCERSSGVTVRCSYHQDLTIFPRSRDHICDWICGPRRGNLHRWPGQPLRTGRRSERRHSRTGSELACVRASHNASPSVVGAVPRFFGPSDSWGVHWLRCIVSPALLAGKQLQSVPHEDTIGYRPL